jgi:hypothetical protein
MPAAGLGVRPRLFYGWTVVATAPLVLFMAYGTQYAFGVFFAAFVEEFGWSRASLSGVFSLYAFIYSVFALPPPSHRPVGAARGHLDRRGLARDRADADEPRHRALAALPALRNRRPARNVDRVRAVQRHCREVVHSPARHRGRPGQRGWQPRHLRAPSGRPPPREPARLARSLRDLRRRGTPRPERSGPAHAARPRGHSAAPRRSAGHQHGGARGRPPERMDGRPGDAHARVLDALRRLRGHLDPIFIPLGHLVPMARGLWSPRSWPPRW